MPSSLHLEVKRLILQAVNRPDLRPEEIGDRDPLFGEGSLGLDSLDALEIAVALHRRWGVRLDDKNLARKILADVDTIVTWLRGQGIDAA